MKDDDDEDVGMIVTDNRQSSSAQSIPDPSNLVLDRASSWSHLGAVGASFFTDGDVRSQNPLVGPQRSPSLPEIEAWRLPMDDSIPELCNRVRVAPRDLQTCHCHDNDGARSRYRQHRDSTHEGRGVSRGIPRTIETTPRNSEIPAWFALAYDSESTVEAMGAPISRSVC